jgi:hypothetical protein
LSFLPDARGDCTFERGDANLDGTINIADALRILGVLFLGDAKPDCEDVMDANDVGAIDISDPVYLLGFLFNGTEAPPSPFRGCGPDPSADALSCNVYASCAGCVSEAGFQAALALLAMSTICVPAGTAPIDAGVATLEIVPENRAQPCGNPPSPGWPVQLTAAQGALDLPGRKVRLHVEGTITDMPVVVRSILTTTCFADITFAGDIDVGFQTTEAGGDLVVTALDSLRFVNPTFNISATGGVACSLGATLAGFLETFIIDEIEAAFARELPALSRQLGCLRLCPEG